MNILHLQTNLNLTCGVTKSIYLLCKKMDDDFRQSVITLGGDAIDKFHESNIEVYSLNRNRNSVFNTIKIISKIYNYCKNNKINIIHSHHRYFDLISYFISFFLPVKTICSVHSKVNNFAFISYKSEILIAVGITIKDHLINQFSISPNRIHVINNFIDPSEARINNDKDQLKETHKIPVENYVIGFIGRFNVKEKGIDILLEAAKYIYKDNINITLLFVGKGEDELYIKNFSDKSGIPILIIAPKKNIFDYYNICDMIVLPSRIDPFPLCALETGMMRKPFIGSKVDGIKEIIEDQIDGLLFEKENPTDLVNKIKMLLSDNTKSKYLADNLYEKVISKYSDKVIIPKIRDIYVGISDK